MRKEVSIKICPKCKGNMIKGKVFDMAYIIVRQQRWCDGNMFTGREHKVDSYVCGKCGFMEEYVRLNVKLEK